MVRDGRAQGSQLEESEVVEVTGSKDDHDQRSCSVHERLDDGDHAVCPSGADLDLPLLTAPLLWAATNEQGL